MVGILRVTIRPRARRARDGHDHQVDIPTDEPDFRAVRFQSKHFQAARTAIFRIAQTPVPQPVRAPLQVDVGIDQDQP
ncbi:MAG: hypothetical protein ABI794_12340 [Betaproteobacteria bacterium]